MIGRARLFFFVALLIAVAILVTNFPLGALVQERSAVRADSAQLLALQAENQVLFVTSPGSARPGDGRSDRA